jgi:hypothetical protein
MPMGSLVRLRLSETLDSEFKIQNDVTGAVGIRTGIACV